MSSTISNLCLSLPVSSERRSSSKLPCNALPSIVRLSGRGYQNSIKSRVGGEGREDLDHLQRTNKQQQPQVRRRASPVAPVGLWDRFPTARTVQQMMETMERMMEEPFAYSSSWPSSSATEAGGYSRVRTPWEIKEGEEDYKLRFDMPGMTKDDVKVWVEQNMLVVKAEKVPKTKNQNGQEYGDEGGVWSTKSYGSYSSRIALPENIQFEKIKAEVKDGVLYITIPKATTSGKVLDINVQ